MNNLLSSKHIADSMIIMPAVLMALTPFSMEESMNMSFFGYDMFVFLIIGVVAFIFRLLGKKNNKPEAEILLLFFVAVLSSLRYLFDFYFAHLTIECEFILGYILAKNIQYDKIMLKIIHYICLIMFLFILFQQVSFSMGLGFLSTGQRNVEIVDGILRAGTSAGGATFTAIFMVLLSGLIMATDRNHFYNYINLGLGVFSAIISGTRSAIIVMLLASAIYLLFTAKRHFIYVAMVFAIFLVCFFPTLQNVYEARNAEAIENYDLSSGRSWRWIEAFEEMDKDEISYIIGKGGGTVPISNYNKHIEVLASPHNAFIGVFFQFGLFGFLILLVFLYRRAKLLYRRFSIGVIVLALSVLVCWNSEVVTLSYLYAFFFWMLYFVELRLVKEEQQQKDKTNIVRNEKNRIYKRT